MAFQQHQTPLALSDQKKFCAASTQWAAVSTWRGETREPPQKSCEISIHLVKRRATCRGYRVTTTLVTTQQQQTCQGYSFCSVSTPPTTRVCLRASPQLHWAGAGAGGWHPEHRAGTIESSTINIVSSWGGGTLTTAFSRQI